MSGSVTPPSFCAVGPGEVPGLEVGPGPPPRRPSAHAAATSTDASTKELRKRTSRIGGSLTAKRGDVAGAERGDTYLKRTPSGEKSRHVLFYVPRNAIHVSSRMPSPASVSMLVPSAVTWAAAAWKKRPAGG